MKKIDTIFDEVFIYDPIVYGDDRGYFYESFRQDEFEVEFCQDNQSFTKNKGTFRGIHFQNEPYAQDKLVRVISGEVIDYVVDLRKGSSTYRKWIGVNLSSENKRQLFIPKGFGHGFLTITDDVIFAYKCSNYYNKEADRSISYADRDIGIDFPIEITNLSEKDKNAPNLEDSDCNFKIGR